MACPPINRCSLPGRTATPAWWSCWTPTLTMMSHLTEHDGIVEYPEFRPFLVGIVERCGMPPALCYDRTAVLEYLAEQIGDYHQALEHFEYNVMGGYCGPTTPFFLDREILEK